MTTHTTRPFLTAEWRYLAMVNYAVDPAVLRSLTPAGTELDFFNGTTYVSMVGFLFHKTRVWGLPIPFHRNFDEVNLRFYVRRKVDGEWRRGVVFIREIAPRRAVVYIARRFYGENYIALPMRHEVPLSGGVLAPRATVRYTWTFNGRDNALAVTTQGGPQPWAAGSEAEFITEHYWGYTRQPDGGTVEYRVDHPPWRVWDAAESSFTCDVAALYGSEFVETLSAQPTSAFVAEGSRVTVYRGVRL